MRRSALASSPSLLLALVLLTGCDSNRSYVVVASIEPARFLAHQSSPFTIRGSGFAQNGVTRVEVRFRAADDVAPFANGTSPLAVLEGTVVSDTEITGMTPVTFVPGGFGGIVEVNLGGDQWGTSREPIAEFLGRSVFSVDPEEVVASTPTSVRIRGFAFFPRGGRATARFTARAGQVFPSGSPVLDVPGIVLDATTILCSTPALALFAPLSCTVTIVLDDVPGAPRAASTAELLVFAPPPEVPVTVDAIASEFPLLLREAQPVLVTGSGFLGGGTDAVKVVFEAAAGTPFLGGTSTIAEVFAVASSDTSIPTTSPTGAGTGDVAAFVRVVRADGERGRSALAIAQLAGSAARLTSFDPVQVPGGPAATVFTISGDTLPAGTLATVRFAASSGTPFLDGTSPIADVVAQVTSPTRIAGVSPLATVPRAVSVEVTVFLADGTLLPLGRACAFLPAASAPTAADCVVTNLDDQGAGSLRDRLANAPQGCVITFAPGLQGTVPLQSTLEVTAERHLLGPGTARVRLSAGGGDFPVLTVRAGAALAIERLGIHGSGHRSDGGGVVLERGASLDMQLCEVADNLVGGDGAAVHAAGASAQILGCRIGGNQSAGRGGALFLTDGAAVRIAGSTLDANVGFGGGGAVCADAGAALTIENSTLQDNAALGTGGGGVLLPSDAAVTLVHCTLADNLAASRGGGARIDAGVFTARNCIFSRNADGPGNPELAVRGGVLDVTSCLVRVGAGSELADGVDGNLVGAADAPTDPRLDPFARSGGPTRTRSPRQGSPVLGFGDPAWCTPTDQRGSPRPAGLPDCDLGAVEVREL